MEGTCTAACVRLVRVDERTVNVERICEHRMPYLAGKWTDGIHVVTAGPTWEGVIAARTQCPACRLSFGRWWSLEGENRAPTAEAVRERLRALLIERGFVRTGEGWTCPLCANVEGGQLLDDIRLGEGAPPPCAGPWEEGGAS
jgi:hypothetical protein